MLWCLGMEYFSLKRAPVSTGSLTTFLCLLSFFIATPVHSHGDGSNEANSNETERYQLVVWDFQHVEIPYVICLWILLASVAKIGFHLYDRLSSILPESCLLIVMGIVVGGILHYTHTANTSQYVLDANTFFLFLLPPIIYDAGYHMPLRAFFNNLGTILLLAVVNTLWNTVAIGLSLWAVSYLGWISAKISILHCLMFSALISAVDPVAVLAVFEDVHVNEMLYIIVFGESLLNDGVTVVLYHMMEGYTEIGEANIQAVDYAAGIGSFFIIAMGGTLIGVIYGLIGGFITKYTDHVRIIEPLFVFTLGYLAYLTAEMMHLSGILALTFGGITMRHYVEANMNEKSVTTTKYTLKMMANISETVIFMFLGLSTITDTLDWQWDFIFFSILFCIVYRVVGIVCLSFLTNRRRVIRLSGIDQFIMSYGGLRGGIAFCLSLLIDEKLVQEKNMFVTTTIIVVFFTVFIQGITIKPVVNALKVKRAEEKNPTMSEMLNERLIDHLMAGMEDIIGRTSHNSIKNRFEHFNTKLVKPLLLRNKPQTRETSILAVFSRLNVRDAMNHITSHGTFLGPLVVPDSKLPNGLGARKSSASLSDSTDVYYSPPPTVTDIHSVEAVYSKKDYDDSRMHHMLEDAMFRPRRTFVVEKKHTLDEHEKRPELSHHEMHQHLRRLIDISMQEQYDHYDDVSPTKVHVLTSSDTAVTADETKVPPKEDPLSKAKEEKEEEENKEEEGENKEEEGEKKEEEAEEEKVKFTLGAGAVERPHGSHDSGMSDSDEGGATSVQSEETEAQRVLPWKRTTRLPPIRSSVSLSMPDDDHPLMSQAPSWADNLAYNHLTESGSPYVSPQNTIGAPAPSSSHRPVFDIFPPSPDHAAPAEDSSPTTSQEKVDSGHDPLPPPWSSPQGSLPAPWASQSSEDPPLTSPESHDMRCGEKASTYLQSSSHNYLPPSHHSCLAEVVQAPQPSSASVRLRPSNSPKHFQPIQMEEMCSQRGIEAEVIADEADYQERLVTRVQSWLDTSEPSDCDDIQDPEEMTSNKADDDHVHHNDTDDDLDLDDSHLDTYL
ncbi:sodium/hydrogen exchanger 3-like [Littorina saxatilis]|uniref:Sodium/hydrogen exchanger n=1 Tax=Littorina saxatilis TaxID=31220 RepID=A0AAN9BZZ1_9CAEN